MPKVAGIDSSTQSVKIVICDAQTGEMIATSTRPHPDGTEVDPSFWWQALQEVIADVGGLDQVAAVAIAGQQHGMVVLDSSGEIIRPALLWNDVRSGEDAVELNQQFPDIHKMTGSKMVPSFTVTKLRWLARREPENASRVAAIALPHDWLSWKLSGSKNLLDLFTDRSEASGTGYFDPSTNQYLPEILRAALGTSDVLLPKIISPNKFGWDQQNIKIAPGAGDNAGAALGLGAQPGDLVISLGTSGVAFAISKTPTHDVSGEVAGFADATGNFLPLACTLNAAKIFDGVAELLKVDFEGLSALALQANPGAGGLLFMPHFDGERTPNRPDAQGAIAGVTHQNFTAANIARASIEGVISGIAYAAHGFESLGVRSKRVFLIGGAARNPAVQQITSEIFGQDINIPEPGEYVANGAARQAAWALMGEIDPPAWKSSKSTIVPCTHNSRDVREKYFAAIAKI